MTTISPLLQSRIDNVNKAKKAKTLTNRHEKIYEDLQKTAHEAEPNAPKAYIVKQGLLGDPVAATKDMLNDGKNFFKVVRSGKISDNNLGRINDLGLKVGSALIATYLALHSKTKTESIMRFVGGGTFLAAMALWPKLFINIPARLVHGFRIDDKYINAYGDKKDFFLDNQYLSWDAFPEEQMRKNAQRAGIDYDSPNGKEKIQRKMQKTALQNRTLWMATAGFATPLLTSMTCNAIEPKINEAVIRHDFKKIKDIVYEGGIPEFIKSLEPAPLNNDRDLRNLIAEYKEVKIDDNFYTRLKNILMPSDFIGKFKDSDEKNVFNGFAPLNIGKAFKDLREKGSLSIVDKDDLIEFLKKTIDETSQPLKNGEIIGPDSLNMPRYAKMAQEQGIEFKPFSEAQINDIINSIGKDFSRKHVREVLEQQPISYNIRENIMNNVKTDDSKFFEFIKKYNEGPLATIRGRIKGYIDLINPLVGEKDESIAAISWRKQSKNLLDRFGFKHDDLLEIRKSKNSDELIDILSKKVSEQVKDLDDNQYNEYIRQITNMEPKKGFLVRLADSAKKENFITRFIKKQAGKRNFITRFLEKQRSKSQFKGWEKVADELENINNIKSIAEGIEIEGITKEQLKALNSAVLGAENETKGIMNILRNFLDIRKTDYTATHTQPALCANFERKLAKGVFKDVLDENDIKVARKLLYDGNISTIYNLGYAADGRNAKRIAKLIYDQVTDDDIKKYAKKDIKVTKDMFEFGAAEKAIPKLKETAEKLCQLVLNPGDVYETATKKYLRGHSIVQAVTTRGTRVGNDLSWLKIFAPITIGLIAITLLVQPFFGNIKKEFPEEKKGGIK